MGENNRINRFILLAFFRFYFRGSGFQAMKIVTYDTNLTAAQWVKSLRPKLAVEVVKRSDATKAFKVLPRCWIVERTFG